ncbi:MAG: hypothetical protein ACOY82_18360 [Pseudomonadota bacterium]
MRCLSPIGVLFLGLTLGPVAGAHDGQPQGWCEDPEAEPLIVAQFSYSQTALQNFRQSIIAQAAADKVCPEDLWGDLIPAQPGDSCGVVDEWHYANLLAFRYCTGLNPNLPLEDRAMPFVSAPADFNSDQGHHALYRFSDGKLNGACVVCRAPSAPPPPEGGD